MSDGATVGDMTSSPAQTLGAGAGTAVTGTPDQSTGTENAASESTVETGASTEPSGGQPTAEDGQNANGEGGTNRRRPSIYDTVKELRAERREARVRETEFLRQIQELRQAMEQANAPKPGVSERNPADFWQDPEGRLERLMEDRLGRLEEGLAGRFEQSREAREQEQVLNQERSEAVEFIRSQKGYSSDDDEDLIDIINEQGLQTLSPKQAAKAAWAIFQQDRGVGDRSLAKARATGVVGQPPGVGFGRKVWSKAEYDQTIDALERNPKGLTKELEAELLSAAREGRVR